MKDNTEMNANILAKIPCKYSEMVTALKNCIDKLKTKLMMTMIRKFWERKYKKSNDKKKKVNKALNVENKNKNKKKFSKQHKGTCSICRKQGHPAKNCWENPNCAANNAKNNGLDPEAAERKKKVTCFNCNKKGHYSSECKSGKNENQLEMFAGMANLQNDPYATLLRQGIMAGQ